MNCSPKVVTRRLLRRWTVSATGQGSFWCARPTRDCRVRTSLSISTLPLLTCSAFRLLVSRFGRCGRRKIMSRTRLQTRQCCSSPSFCHYNLDLRAIAVMTRRESQSTSVTSPFCPILRNVDHSHAYVRYKHPRQKRSPECEGRRALSEQTSQAISRIVGA